MENKFKNLGTTLNMLSSNELRQTLGGAYKRNAKPTPKDNTLANLVAIYVPVAPPPGTYYLYGSFYNANGERVEVPTQTAG